MALTLAAAAVLSGPGAAAGVQPFGLLWLPSCSLLMSTESGEGETQPPALRHSEPPEQIRLSLIHTGVSAYGLSLSATLPGGDKMLRPSGVI